MHCRSFNIHLSTRKIKLHANQQKILLEEGLNVVSPHFTTWVFKHYPQIYSKFTTLSSQYKVKMKNNDPLVLVQGYFNLKSSTLSSQYKVKMKNNDPLVLVQGHFNLKSTTLSSQYEGQNEEQRPSRLSTRSLQ